VSSRRKRRSPRAQSKAKDAARSSRIWTTVERVLAVFGGIAAVCAIGALLWATVRQTPPYQRYREAQMIARLDPGQDFDSATLNVGERAKYRKVLRSGRTAYMFDRQWEYIVLLVDQGRVLSVGVFSKSPRLHATVGRQVSVNGPSVGSQKKLVVPIDAVGYCGAHDGQFLERFSLALASDARNVIVGWTSETNTGSASGAPLCEAAHRCGETYPLEVPTDSGLSTTMRDCLSRNNLNGLNNLLRASVVIVTAPHQWTLKDMLIRPAVLMGFAPDADGW